MSTLPKVGELGKGSQNHYDMRSGGHFWTVEYRDKGLEKWEGRDTRHSPAVRFWKLLGVEGRYAQGPEICRAYWLREGSEAYKAACQEQGITDLDPELLASPGVDWRAIQREEDERLAALIAKAREERAARIEKYRDQYAPKPRDT